jgi:hypothetical protein
MSRTYSNPQQRGSAETFLVSFQKETPHIMSLNTFVEKLVIIEEDWIYDARTYGSIILQE